MGSIQIYEDVMGQRLNKKKCCFVINKKLSCAKVDSIRRITGFSQNHLPINYLGCPLFTGRNKICLYDDMIHKVKKRMESWENKALSIGGRVILLRSIINSMPYYLFQSLQPPSGIFKNLGKICNAFLWGTTDKNKHVHWRSWKRVCCPVSEGGMGIKSAADMTSAFSLKLWWRFRTFPCLWSDYLLSKYCRNCWPSHAVAKVSDSHCWKRLCKARIIAEDKICWSIGAGKINFWFDKWFYGKAFADCCPYATHDSAAVAVYLEAGNWNFGKLRSVLPLGFCELVRAIPIGCMDTPIWCDDSCSSFNTKSTWNMCRQQLEQDELLDWLWHKSIPIKISVLGWRLLKNLLPVDEKMKTFGIQGPSKCQCCFEQETIHHVFVGSQIAKEVWEWFHKITSMANHSYANIKDVFYKWKQSHSRIGKGHIRIILLLIILWAMWKARNAAKHNNLKMQSKNIIIMVEMKIKAMVKSGIITDQNSKNDNDLNSYFGISKINKSRSLIKIVHWKKPDEGWIKMNIDGCSKGNPGVAGAGGIIRDCLGNVICTFSLSLGIQSSYMAELLALLEGIKIISILGFQHVWIEADSLILVNQINKGHKGCWRTFMYFSIIYQALGMIHWRFSHIWREANAAADFMANRGLGNQSLVIDFSIHTYGLLKGITLLDKMAYPYVRLA